MIGKKSMWVGLAGAVIIFGATIIYTQFNSVVHIKKNGFSFSYPESLRMYEVPSTEGNYANYHISLADSQKARSYISVSIPLKNTSQALTILENNQPLGKESDIQSAVLNGHTGQTMTYRQDTNWEGDIPVHGRTTFEQYTSRYENSPIVLRFFRDDQDSSLDAAWEKIRSSIEY